MFVLCLPQGVCSFGFLLEKKGFGWGRELLSQYEQHASEGFGCYRPQWWHASEETPSVTNAMVGLKRATLTLALKHCSPY